MGNSLAAFSLATIETKVNGQQLGGFQVAVAACFRTCWRQFEEQPSPRSRAPKETGR
jgi:hypothetical protein